MPASGPVMLVSAPAMRASGHGMRRPVRESSVAGESSSDRVSRSARATRGGRETRGGSGTRSRRVATREAPVPGAEDMGSRAEEVRRLAADVVAAATAAGLTIGTAESLTGGLVSAAITAIPGASACHRGAVVSYATEVKAQVLGVPAALLAERGAVDPEVALAMATGAARVLSCDLAVATTGVAGPEPADGKPVGCVFVAVNSPPTVERLDRRGDRASIREQSVSAALALLLAAVRGRSVDSRNGPESSGAG
ncbi:Competence/damage-inducible protein cinA (modular protein) [Nostocoides jenkinsii Ben 74]|uniref:Competence/damage-inducible protein cinA (Modular protein) n=1 Tax=Nostocoides jenkinsii Ben 74 TaxID=1193518 RepID=A0A077MDT1_9MICO|nr:Competence/damage-inducible protein cinA (modular protein) [Tetrasphaera jenkinsii Ben 74]